MSSTTFIWDIESDSLLAENGSDHESSQYTFEPVEYGSLISVSRANVQEFFHFDAQMSIRQLSTQQGDITDQAIYTAFGKAIVTLNSTIQPLGYVGGVGYYTEPGAERISVRARVYDNANERWISLDPIGSDAGEHNPYEYARNQPVNYVDPSGLIPIIESTVACSPRIPGVVTYASGRNGAGANAILSVGDAPDFMSLEWLVEAVQGPGISSNMNITWKRPIASKFMRNATCCCCNKVGFFQTARWEMEYLFHTVTNGTVVDGSLPYKHQTPGNPCPGTEIDTNQIALRDAPNMPIEASMWGPVLSGRQELETCVVCLDGVEGLIRRPYHIIGLVVYGCVKWGINIKRLKPFETISSRKQWFVRRHIHEKQKWRYFDIPESINGFQIIYDGPDLFRRPSNEWATAVFDWDQRGLVETD